jgi:hypothetical protein
MNSSKLLKFEVKVGVMCYATMWWCSKFKSTGTNYHLYRGVVDSDGRHVAGRRVRYGISYLHSIKKKGL